MTSAANGALVAPRAALCSTALPYLRGAGSRLAYAWTSHWRAPGDLALEWAAGRDACAERRAEFATGRWCARRALRRLGHAPALIPVGDLREPLWPDGVVGSITHTEGLCIAAVSDTLAGLGVDAEPLSRDLTPRMLSRICSPGERAALRQSSEPAVRSGLASFCAKEAFYKAIFAEVRRYVDFLEVEVEIAWEHRSFNVVPPAELGASLRRGRPAARGVIIVVGRFLVCCVALPRRAARAETGFSEAFEPSGWHRPLVTSLPPPHNEVV